MKQLNSSKNSKSSDSLNNSNIHFDRGVELILRGGKRKPKTYQILLDKVFKFLNREIDIHLDFSLNVKKYPPEIKMNLEVSLVIGSFVTLLFFVVGILIGWTAREYMKNYREVPRPHPEMFDMQGNLIPDEIVAFNFENYHDTENNSEDEET